MTYVFIIVNMNEYTTASFSGVGEVDTVGYFTFVVEGIFLTTIAVIGIFCNSFAILLIVRSFADDDVESSTFLKKNREVKRMLIGLAVFDLVYLFMAQPLQEGISTSTVTDILHGVVQRILTRPIVATASRLCLRRSRTSERTSLGRLAG